MTDCRVLIVGGGPAGLAVAGALPRGTECVLLHQDAEIGRPVRSSGGTWVRDMRALGIPAHLYQVINRLDFMSDRSEAVFDGLSDPMAVLDITGTYRHLGGLATTRGCDIRLGTTLTAAGLLPDGRVGARLRGRDGAEQEIRADWVIDASGWKMAVLAALGLRPRPGRTGVGYEFEFPRGAFPADRAVLFVGSAALTGYGWVFPAPNDRLRLGVGVIHPDTDLSPRRVMDRLRASGAAARFGVDLPEEMDTQAGIIPSVAYDPVLRFGRVLRVGDSANMATPTVGEGIRIAVAEGRALGAALTGGGAALGRWERTARRRYARNYRFGLMMNRRIAGYTPQRWDRAVDRLARLPEAGMVAAVRSEFSAGMIARNLSLSALARLRGLA